MKAKAISLKTAVEKLLGYSITQEQYRAAFDRAKNAVGRWNPSPSEIAARL